MKIYVLDTMLSNEFCQLSETANLIRTHNAKVDEPVLKSEATVKNTLVHEGVNVGSTEDAHNPNKNNLLFI